MSVEFSHPLYHLEDNDRIVRNQDAPPKITIAENEEISNELFRYVEAKLVNDYHFIYIPVPDTDDTTTEKTSVLASSNWLTSSKLLLIVQNASGSQMGIFSRSTCFEQGISKGSMIPYVERAKKAGYAIIILRPNTNSITELDPITGKVIKKTTIIGSESPEIHALYVLENIIPQAESLTHIALLGYGHGAILCKDILLRQMVLSKSDGRSEINRIKALVTIEASTIIEEDDPSDVRAAINDMAVNMECNSAPKGYQLTYRKAKLGCTSISLGLPPGRSEVANVAAGISLAIDMVFDYLVTAQTVTKACPPFVYNVAKANGHDPNTAEIKVSPVVEDQPIVDTPTSTKALSRTTSNTSNTSTSETTRKSVSIFSRIFKGKAKDSGASSPAAEPKLTVNDFDLLKVVGKGAFGKVNTGIYYLFDTIYAPYILYAL